MAGFSPATSINDFPAPGIREMVLRGFMAAARQQVKFQDRCKIKWVELPETAANAQYFEIFEIAGDRAIRVELVEYQDYIDLLQTDELKDAARRAGTAAASGYNVLLNAAMRKHGFGLHAVELFTNNLTVKFTINEEPSVANPAGLWQGWIAWRFRFAAGVPM